MYKLQYKKDKIPTLGFIVDDRICEILFNGDALDWLRNSIRESFYIEKL